jgi:hypothetical protein
VWDAQAVTITALPFVLVKGISMVPRKSRTKQVPGPAPAADLALTCPVNDDALVLGVTPDGPARCPTCRRPWFDAKASGLLDMVVLAQDVLRDIQAAIEEETMP